MEMVASVKMQKAVRGILSARSYVQNSWNMLLTLAHSTNPERHALLQGREAGKTCLIFISSDRGLCGSYNSDLTRKLSGFLRENDKSNLDIITVGKKGSETVRKIAPENLIAEFSSFETGATFEDVSPIARLSIDEFESKKYNRVVAVYSHFQSSLKQSPVIKQILPITREHIDIPELWETTDEKQSLTEYKFEPSADLVLSRILPQFIRVQIFGLVLEANASEQSARMVAMKNATDNAGELISDLTLTYNSIRQASITKEIAEIASAAEAMK
jgi:F-type H+-transporting ATPase subunit gamma